MSRFWAVDGLSNHNLRSPGTHPDLGTDFYRRTNVKWALISSAVQSYLKFSIGKAVPYVLYNMLQEKFQNQLFSHWSLIVEAFCIDVLSIKSCVSIDNDYYKTMNWLYTLASWCGSPHDEHPRRITSVPRAVILNSQEWRTCQCTDISLAKKLKWISCSYTAGEGTAAHGEAPVEVQGSHIEIHRMHEEKWSQEKPSPQQRK